MSSDNDSELVIPENLSSLKVRELRTLAEDLGIDTTDMKKNEEDDQDELTDEKPRTRRSRNEEPDEDESDEVEQEEPGTRTRKRRKRGE